MKDEKISIEIPNNLNVLPLVIDSARSISRIMGFPEGETRKIELGVEEAVGNIIRFAFEDGVEETLTIVFSMQKPGLGISVFEKGMPFDPGMIREFSPEKFRKEFSDEGLGMYLMKCFMDEFTFVNHGREGKETRLFKYLPSKNVEEILDETTLQQAKNEREETVLPAGTVKYTVRLMRPEEAVDVSKCAYTSYGYTYVHEAIYYPDRVREMNQTGELISMVAVNDENGEVMAHFAIEKEDDPLVPQVGVAFTKPRYRGQGALNRLNVFLLEEVAKRNYMGFYGKGITTHFYSQKTMLKYGLNPCAFLLSSGKERKYKGIDQKIIQRESVILHFRYMHPEEGLVIFPPEKHRSMITKIYGYINGKPEIMQTHANEGLPDEASVITTKANPNSNTADIFLISYGKDVLTQISKMLTSLCRDKIETIYIRLKLADPLTAVMCEKIEELGFFFAGIMPGSGKGDVLILQYLNNHVIDYNYISLACEESKSILDYVRKQAPRLEPTI
jgi:anti-sigma regulatory factor (Ser/Thr protein kinase)